VGLALVIIGVGKVISGGIGAFPVMLVGGIVAFIVFKQYAHYMDAVFDNGYDILIKNNLKEETIPLANIINVRYTDMGRGMNYITLSLQVPCSFGQELSFIPSYKLSQPESEAAHEFIKRIYQYKGHKKDGSN